MQGILTDDNGDLLVERGKLTVGECSADVAERVLRAYPGEFKEVPAIGLFADSQMNGSPDPFWVGSAKKQLRTQGIEVKTIAIKDGQIEIQMK